MGHGELGEGTGFPFFDSILACSDFGSFRGIDQGPRRIAELEEIVHPLPTGQVITVWLGSVFIFFRGSAPLGWGIP